MYISKYSYWDERRFPGFLDHLNNLKINSYNYYANNLNLYKKEKYKSDFEMIDRFLNYMEDYYVFLIRNKIVKKSSYDNVLNQLKSLKLIKIFPDDKRKLYGLTTENSISINPEIPAKQMLNQKEMEQMCVSHELGHIINNAWYNDACKLARELYEDKNYKKMLKNMNLDSYKYLLNGLLLLDEVVAEEMGELVAFKSNKIERPKKEYKTDKAIFCHNPYLTNYLLYGELQDFAVKFARKLKFLNCDNSMSDDEVLRVLCVNSFHKDFINKIRYEFMMSDNDLELLMMLACMGRIKEATYTILGLNDKNSINVNEYVYAFNSSYKKK